MGVNKKICPCHGCNDLNKSCLDCEQYENWKESLYENHGRLVSA